MSDEKLFGDRRTSHFEDDWKKELTVIDDLIHPLKIKSTKQCFIRDSMQENVILCKNIWKNIWKNQNSVVHLYQNR